MKENKSFPFYPFFLSFSETIMSIYSRISTEYLLCGRCCLRWWGFGGEQVRYNLSSGSLLLHMQNKPILESAKYYTVDFRKDMGRRCLWRREKTDTEVGREPAARGKEIRKFVKVQNSWAYLRKKNTRMSEAKDRLMCQ